MHVRLCRKLAGLLSKCLRYCYGLIGRVRVCPSAAAAAAGIHARQHIGQVGRARVGVVEGRADEVPGAMDGVQNGGLLMVERGAS